MNEIERAIEQLESLMYDAGHKGDVEDYNALKTAIDLCRAELSRQENAPLTVEELRDMNEKPAYIVVTDKTNIADPRDAFNGWGMVRCSWVRMWDAKRADLIHVDRDFCDNGITWLAYRYEPKGEKA